MKPYSMDLRERILRDTDGGMQTHELAIKYAVSESWVRRLKQRRRETGEVAPRRAGYRQEPKWVPHAERLKELVAQQPDATLQELRELLGVSFSIHTIARALRALQLTFKKKSFARPSRIGRTSRSDGRPGRPK
jgi:transposase